MIRRPPRSTLSSSSAASDVYKRQHLIFASVAAVPRSNVNIWKSDDTMIIQYFLAQPANQYLCVGNQYFCVGTSCRLSDTRTVLPYDVALDPTVHACDCVGKRSVTRQPPWIPLSTSPSPEAVSYTHLRAHETPEHLVCRLLLEKKKKKKNNKSKTYTIIYYI
eukprot:TRINITY_DN2573_c0_g1_i10.p1 TRINITY_DN2573_c0_g1~~TRINITY_DN2573_c0_g1_i10.p1  ORF type:complete len:163 (+),score=20.27 TRINITY_DN2573_c0_g1_i10:147-635(+)